MKRRHFMQASLGLTPLAHAQATTALHWQTSSFTGLGTIMSIRAAHKDVDMLAQALARARAVVAQVEDEMSLFRPSSALSQLNAAGVLHQPPAGLLQVLRMSQRMAEQSRGAFDVTVQPLWQLYANAQQAGRLPRADEVAHVRQRVGWQGLHVDAQRVQLRQAGMGVSLNGIAQGYAADAVRASLHRDGVAHALIHTGEWSSLGMAEGARDWTLGIADPHRADAWLTRVSMNGLSWATSADEQCSFSADRKHHHIFNPHTGYSPQDIASETVAAPSCALADALTKGLVVGGYDRALHLAKAWGVSAVVVKKNGEWRASSSLPRATA